MSGYTIVGKRVPAKDAVPKVTGEAKYGAKEGDEGTAIATAPTIANAIYDAVGVRITSLPITPEKVLRALQGALRISSTGSDGYAGSWAATAAARDLKRQIFEVVADKLLREQGIKHRLTRVRRPQTNGKVERFHRTLAEEFYASNFFDTVEGLEEALQRWLFWYNHKRRHQGLKGKTPMGKYHLLEEENLTRAA